MRCLFLILFFCITKVCSTNLQTQSTLIATLAASNLDTSKQTTLIKGITAANLTANHLSSVISLISNIILTTQNVAKVISLLTNSSSSNFTLLSSQLTAISLAKTNDLTLLSQTSLANVLASNTGLNACLVGCSNHGLCEMMTNATFACFCRRDYTGDKCQYTSNPCLNGECLNSGVCILRPYLLNSHLYDYTCNCSEYYFGAHCENQVNVCADQACSSRGYCVAVNHKATCVCNQFYSGSQCEIVSSQKKVTEDVTLSSTIIAICVLSGFCLLIVYLDVFAWFKRRREKRTKKQTNE